LLLVHFQSYESTWLTHTHDSPCTSRYSSRITYRWDLSTFDAFEEYPRPEYLARLTKAEKKKLNVITRMYEPYVPFWKKQLPYTILSSSVVLLLILLALASVLGVIVYRVTVRAALANNEDLVNYSSLLTSSTAALLNLLCILIFNQIYG
jgi:anoctamin-1